MSGSGSGKSPEESRVRRRMREAEALALASAEVSEREGEGSRLTWKPKAERPSARAPSARATRSAKASMGGRRVENLLNVAEGAGGLDLWSAMVDADDEGAVIGDGYGSGLCSYADMEGRVDTLENVVPEMDVLRRDGLKGHFDGLEMALHQKKDGVRGQVDGPQKPLPRSREPRPDLSAEIRANKVKRLERDEIRANKVMRLERDGIPCTVLDFSAPIPQAAKPASQPARDKGGGRVKKGNEALSLGIPDLKALADASGKSPYLREILAFRKATAKGPKGAV